jgi:hypothetical protein
MAQNFDIPSQKNEIRKRRNELIMKLKIAKKKQNIFQTFENNYETPILMARNSNSTTDTGS